MNVSPGEFDGAPAIAARFVEARRTARSLPDFPGSAPADLAGAYQVQEAAIGLWPDEIVGWKVGRLSPEAQARLGPDRLAGPIFSRKLWRADGDRPVPFPVFSDGFAAVEAEYVFRLSADAPVGKTDWTAEDVRMLEGDLLCGVETAGSPLATINELGPTVVVSDFGNNAGLILGAPVADWRRRIDGLTSETFIDGRSVGRGGAASIPGGPLESVRFLVEHCARRGRPLKAGQLISTGATTGIHDIRARQSARVDFGADGVIHCTAVAAAPAA